MIKPIDKPNTMDKDSLWAMGLGVKESISSRNFVGRSFAPRPLLKREFVFYGFTILSLSDKQFVVPRVMEWAGRPTLLRCSD